MAKRHLLILSAAIVATVALAGCRPLPGQPGTEAPGEPEALPAPSGDGPLVAVVLYFPELESGYLARVETQVSSAAEEPYEVLALKALIAGPPSEGLGAAMPQGTKLLSFEVSNHVAYVDFSRELKDNHWGGSTGEMATIYSVVNTLTEGGSITGVKFLIEGREEESLAGHYDFTQVFERDETVLADQN